MHESWKSVPGFPDYEVSDQSRVRSMRMSRGKEWRLLTPWLSPSTGYPMTTLTNAEGKPVLLNLHRLVALAFVPNPDPAFNYVLHKVSLDEGGTNHPDNLTWVVTPHERAVLRGEDCPASTLTEAQVLEIRAKKAAGVKSRLIREEYGLTKQNLYNIVRRRSWKHI